MGNLIFFVVFLGTLTMCLARFTNSNKEPPPFNVSALSPEDQKLFATTPPPESATEMNGTLSDEVVRQAVNIYGDFERYGNIDFNYSNDQDVAPDKFKTTCHQQYLRCLLTELVPTKVCGYNGANWHFYGQSMIKWGYVGYYTAPTYCDIYFDNCRRGYTAWRVLDRGFCEFHYKNTDGIYHHRRWLRKNPSLIVAKILDSLPDVPDVTNRTDIYTSTVAYHPPT